MFDLENKYIIVSQEAISELLPSKKSEKLHALLGDYLEAYSRVKDMSPVGIVLPSRHPAYEDTVQFLKTKGYDLIALHHEAIQDAAASVIQNLEEAGVSPELINLIRETADELSAPKNTEVSDLIKKIMEED